MREEKKVGQMANLQPCNLRKNREKRKPEIAARRWKGRKREEK